MQILIILIRTIITLREDYKSCGKEKYRYMDITKIGIKT